MAVLALAATVLIAIVGWIITQMRGRREIRRTMRVEFLLDAYRRLEQASLRAPMTEEQRRDLEGAIGDINLLGSPKQIALAEQFGKDWAREGEGDPTELLLDLRKSLRKELLLEQASRFFILRVSQDDRPTP